jgi:hypothetical protein
MLSGTPEGFAENQLKVEGYIPRSRDSTAWLPSQHLCYVLKKGVKARRVEKS